MIVLPALSGLSALIQLILEGALIGALFGGAISGGGAVITEYQTHGEINQQGVVNVAKQTGEGAVEGAFGGAVTGGIFGVAGAAVHPVLGMIDDFFRSILGWLDDAARGVAGAVDDAVTGIRKTLESVVKGIRGQFNRWRNGWNAQNYKTMVEAPAGTRYVYVMEDSATGLHKIGMTTKAPPERLDNLANAIAKGSKNKLDYTCIIQTDKNSGLESALHKQFASQKKTHSIPHSGMTEWFALSAAQVAAACSY